MKIIIAASRIVLPRPEIKCKNCKHYSSDGNCKAFKFFYESNGKPEHYYISAYQSRSNPHLCGPSAGLFSEK